MSALDVFNNDQYGCVSLTTAINKLPEQPGLLGARGWFKQQPVNTTTVLIEEKQGKLSLVQSSQRGTRKAEMAHEKRKIRSLVVPHFQENDIVLADSFQNVRSFGSESELEPVNNVLNDRMQAMKNNIEATREWQRCGALQGIVYEADGSTVIYNLFTEFGVSQQTETFDLKKTAPATDFKTKATAVRRKIEHAAGGTPFGGLEAVVGDAFWDAMMECDSVKEAYKNWEAASMLSGLQRGGFKFADITWWNYSTKIGSTYYIPVDYAFIVPTGMSDLWIEYLAPADYTETVNTMGKAYYAKQERMKMDKGIELEAQSNMLNICTRPGIPVKCSFTTT